MRSYDQYCSMARSLDVVGDRWNLLIVRELLIQGPSRFTDLRRGLPGVATNLLSDRLRDLESAGVITRVEEPPPVSATLIRLTPRGQGLSGVVRELVRWGAPLMADAPGDAEFRVHWLSLPLRYLCRDRHPDHVEIVVRIGDAADGCDIIADRGEVQVVPVSPSRSATATVAGPPQVLVGLFTGQLKLRKARSLGVTVDGPIRAVERILPDPIPTGDSGD